MLYTLTSHCFFSTFATESRMKPVARLRPHRNINEAASTAGGEARDEAGLEIFDNDGHAQGEAEYREQKRNEAEELQRAVVLEQRADHRNDFNAVAHGVEFGLGTLGTVAVLDGHIFDAPSGGRRRGSRARFRSESPRKALGRF